VSGHIVMAIVKQLPAAVMRC